MSKANHSFSPDVAMVVGVKAAIVFQHLVFLHISNIDRPDSWDGFRYWIKKSARAFTETYEYFTPKEIRGVLDMLEKDGFLISITGNPDDKFDRSKSFSIEQKGFDLMEIKTEQRHVFACDKRANGRAKKGKCHVDKRANANSYNPYKKENTVENDSYAFEDFWNDYGFKIGAKASAERRFKKLTSLERQQIRDTLPLYKADTVTKEVERGKAFRRMRKHPEFYLSGRIWESYVDALSERKKEEQVFPEWDVAYNAYIDHVKKHYPKVLQFAKYLSKRQFVSYRTEFYVQGKSFLDIKTEEHILLRAHDKVELSPTDYQDVFSQHCILITERLKINQI